MQQFLRAPVLQSWNDRNCNLIFGFGIMIFDTCGHEKVYCLGKNLLTTLPTAIKLTTNKGGLAVFTEKMSSQNNEILPSEEAQQRLAFEQFKSNICHRVKAVGDIPFIMQLLESNQIRKLYEKKWYPEALYLLAMLDYLSRENDIPLYKNYNDIRAAKLSRPVYPSSIVVMCEIMNSNAPKESCLQEAIPEFLRFNIVECDVRNVC